MSGTGVSGRPTSGARCGRGGWRMLRREAMYRFDSSADQREDDLEGSELIQAAVLDSSLANRKWPVFFVVVALSGGAAGYYINLKGPPRCERGTTMAETEPSPPSYS